MTRVVIVQEYIPQYRVAFFEQLTKLARAEGIEVVIAAGRPNAELSRRSDGATPGHILPIAQKEFRIAGRRIVIRNIIKATRGADVVVLEQGRRNLDIYLLFLPRFFRRATYALWGHGRDYVEKRSRFSMWLQKKVTSRSDWFFAYTPGGAAYVASLPFAQDSITVVMNSVDTVAIREGLSLVSSGDITDFRNSWNITGRIASFIGAVDASKRLPFLLDTIRLLRTRHPELAFVIAGDGALLHELKEEAAQMTNVHFIGRVEAQMKNILLAASDLLLVPGRVGLVAVDSLAAGVPIASTDWPFHAPEFEYLIPDVTSVISPDSVHDYAKAIDELLSNEGRLESLAENSLVAGEKLSVEQMALNFLGGIKGALGKKVSS